MYESFNSFYRQCNQIIGNKIGVGLDDLPDARWRDYFDEGMSPHEAIECAYEDFWSDHFPPASSNIEQRAESARCFFCLDLKENLRTQVFFSGASPQARPPI